jgi:hypothetical protein
MGANAQTAVPVFTAGQVLTAQQQTEINTGIPVFATTVTRDAAFGGTGEKALAEGQFAYIEATNATQYYDGAAWQSVGFTPTSAIFNESQASGTSAGTFTAGSYVKRVLNTTVKNDISGCSLASSVITLPAGTYQVFATANAFSVDRHKLKLRNTTDSTDTQIGTSNETQASSATVATIVQGLFTITASKNFEVQHRCQTTRATDGLGRAVSFGDDEVYCTITITKVA